MKGGLMGRRMTTQLNGKTVVVDVIEIEQDINSRHRGKYRCRNLSTGRTLHRTERQLHPLLQSDHLERMSCHRCNGAGVIKGRGGPGLQTARWWYCNKCYGTGILVFCDRFVVATGANRTTPPIGDWIQVPS